MYTRESESENGKETYQERRTKNNLREVSLLYDIFYTYNSFKKLNRERGLKI